jgi:DNA-binding MarR family transcriptional regulator
MPVRIYLQDPIEEAWLLFHQTYDSVTKCEDDLFSKIGLPLQQFAVMGAIKSIRAPVTLSSVSDWLDRNPNSITLIIDRMGKKGLVERVRDLKDRRAIRLVITEKGEEKHQQAWQPRRELTKKILSCLSTEELSTFVSILRKIRETTFEYRNIKDKVSDETLPPPQP